VWRNQQLHPNTFEGCERSKELPMRTLTTIVVLAVTLSVLLAGPAHGQVFLKKSRASNKALTNITPSLAKATPLPKGSDKLTVVKNNRGDMVLPKYNVLAGLRIKQFVAHRDGGVIQIKGEVSNIAVQTMNCRYELSKWTGSGWTVLISGTPRLLDSRESMRVSAQQPDTIDEQRFKLEAYGDKNEYTFKEFKLAARKPRFVVRYGTSGDWILAREYHNDLSNGFDASVLARKMNPLGLDTRIRKKKTTGIDTPFSTGTSIYTALSVHTSEQIERAFEDRNEAEQFRRALISLVKDRRLTVESVRTE
jgi:hypothetical protein